MKKKLTLGFTQIELIISMGILLILISVLMTVFGQIVDVQLESKAISSVDQNGRYLLARLTHDMQSADGIVLPASAGQVSDTLQITVNSINYIYKASASGNFVIINNFGTDVLNSNTASISALSFQRVGSGGINDTIRVSFTVTSRVKQVSGNESKNFQTTLGLQ